MPRARTRWVKTFYPPGTPVAEQEEIFERITVKRLKAIAPDLPDEKLTPLAEVAKKKAAFYHAALGRRSGIVEVLATLPA